MTRLQWLLVAGVGALVLYEIIAAAGHPAPTISELIWQVADRPVVPFAFGLLMGHLFLPRRIR